LVRIKSPDDIAKMRRAGQVVARTLQELAAAIRPGKTTGQELDRLAEKLVREAGGVPSFKGYRGYPKSICLSINEQVVHGIPDGRVLQEGDVASIDLGVKLDGFHGDAAVTVPVGRISADADRLLKVTREALMLGVEMARPGGHLHDIGGAVQAYVEKHGYSVVRELVGHGIGRELHEDPQVPNFGKPGTGLLLTAGMTLAIEPMVNQGTHRVTSLADRWTVVTADGRLSAHFEHTVAICEDGPEVLTEP